MSGPKYNDLDFKDVAGVKTLSVPVQGSTAFLWHGVFEFVLLISASTPHQMW